MFSCKPYEVFAFMNCDRDKCCPVGQTTCGASWWLIPVSTSIATSTLSTSAAASTTLIDSSRSLITSSLQAILQTAVPLVATAPCFLNPSYTSQYTIPSWFTDLPSPAQSYYSSLNVNSTASCVIKKPSTGLSAGAKGGIAGGAVAGACVIIGVILWFLRKRMSASRRGHTTATGREPPIETIVVAANDWKESSGNEAWSGPSSPSSPGWGAASGVQLGTELPVSRVAETPRAAEQRDVVLPLMVGGARDLREENNALIPVTYMPYRPPMSPTPSRHLSRRPVGSPPPGELAGGRNYHASEVDGSSSGNGSGSPVINARFSTISYELLGREVYDNAGG